MKLITAVVAEDQVNPVAHALSAFGAPTAAVFSVLTPTTVRRWEVYRGHPHAVDVVGSVRVEIVANDADTDDIVRAIHSAAEPGPGWLWVTTVDSVARLAAQSCRAQAPLSWSHDRDRGDGPEGPER